MRSPPPRECCTRPPTCPSAAAIERAPLRAPHATAHEARAHCPRRARRARHVGRVRRPRHGARGTLAPPGPSCAGVCDASALQETALQAVACVLGCAAACALSCAAAVCLSISRGSYLRACARRGARAQTERGRGAVQQGAAIRSGAEKAQKRGEAWRCGEVRRGAGRCWEVLGGAGRCWEVLGGVGRCWEVRGGAGRCGAHWRGSEKAGRPLRPSDWKSSVSAEKSGLGVVRSLSPVKIEFAPAMNMIAWLRRRGGEGVREVGKGYVRAAERRGRSSNLPHWRCGGGRSGEWGGRWGWREPGELHSLASPARAARRRGGRQRGGRRSWA